MAAPSNPRPRWLPMMPPAAAPPSAPITVPVRALGPSAQEESSVAVMMGMMMCLMSFICWIFLIAAYFPPRRFHCKKGSTSLGQRRAGDL